MNAPAPEFSRIVSVARISPTGVEKLLESKADERIALAKRFDLIDLKVLKAELTLTPGSQQTINATGTIHADLVQRCVVTLEPLTTHLNLNVDVVFIPSGRERDVESTDPQELDDEFEFFSEGKIDLGEMVAQQLGVNIDPYPRKPDAALPVTEFGVKVEKPRPMAALASIVKNKKNKDKTKD
jgi:hypothetical protein